MSDIRLYQMCAEDVYAAETVGQAVDCMIGMIGEEAWDVIDHPYEIDADEMETRVFWWEPEVSDEKLTLRAGLERMIAEGVTFPCLFCSTEY